MNTHRIAIIGAGNIGTAIARGLVESERFQPAEITLTRRKTDRLAEFQQRGFQVEGDNRTAVQNSDVIIIAVEPQQVDGVLAEIKPELENNRHTLISVVTGVTTAQITGATSPELPVVRAMPNTAIAVRESMTCIASDMVDGPAVELAQSIFDAVGTTLVIGEERMIAATALGACGVAFFLRAIRAASQGGIEIGFHAGEALAIASQTARGAASLLLSADNHPEYEIDRVTTPRGCTIAGLNHMEHQGFSSALIQGITISAEKAASLYSGDVEN